MPTASLPVRLLVAAALGLLPGAYAAADDVGLPAGPPPADAALVTPGGADVAVTDDATRDVGAAGGSRFVEVGANELPLSLREALEQALSSDLGLAERRLDLPIAAQLRLQAEAGFDRLLTAGVDLRRDEEPSTTSFFGSGAIRTTTYSAYGGVRRRLPTGGEVSLLYRADRIDTSRPLSTVNPAWRQGVSVDFRVPLGQGGGSIARSEILKAHNGMAAARAGEEAAVEDLVLAVLRAYWELAFAQRDLAARVASESVASELLDDIQARIQAEVATPLDAAEARAGLERRRSERLLAERTLDDASDALLALIRPFRDGSTAPRVVAVDDPDAPTFLEADGELPVARAVALALGARPELRALQAELATRGVEVLEAKDALRPTIDLIGSASTVGYREGWFDSLKDTAGGEALSMGLGVEVSLYLGQRAAKARFRAAGWAREQTQLRMRQLENQIIQDVRRAHRAMGTASSVRRAADAEVAAARESLDGERQRLAESKSTPYRVLEQEELLTEARTRLTRAQIDTRIAEAELWRAAGSLSERLRLTAPRFAPCDRCSWR